MSCFVTSQIEKLANGLLSTPCRASLEIDPWNANGLDINQAMMIYGMLVDMYPACSYRQLEDMQIVIRKLIAEAIILREVRWDHSPAQRSNKKHDRVFVSGLTEQLVQLLMPYFEHIHGKIHNIKLYIDPDIIKPSFPC